MNRRVAAVLVGTLLAMAGASLWVPVVPAERDRSWEFAMEWGYSPTEAVAKGYERPGLGEYLDWQVRPWPTLYARWVWNLDYQHFDLSFVSSGWFRGNRARETFSSVHMPTLIAELLAILALGGCTMWWIVARERRRAAALEYRG